MAKRMNPIWVAVVLVGAFLLYTGISPLESGTASLKLLVKTGTNPVSGVLCYMNPSGSSACINSEGNDNKCQWKATSGSDGVCYFAGPFNTSTSWPIAVMCSSPNTRVSKTISLLPGTNTIEVYCGAQPSTTTTTIKRTTTTLGGSGSSGGESGSNPNEPTTTSTLKKIDNSAGGGTVASSGNSNLLYGAIALVAVALYVKRSKRK